VCFCVLLCLSNNTLFDKNAIFRRFCFSQVVQKQALGKVEMNSYLMATGHQMTAHFSIFSNVCRLCQEYSYHYYYHYVMLLLAYFAVYYLYVCLSVCLSLCLCLLPCGK